MLKRSHRTSGLGLGLHVGKTLMSNIRHINMSVDAVPRCRVAIFIVHYSRIFEAFRHRGALLFFCAWIEAMHMYLVNYISVVYNPVEFAETHHFIKIERCDEALLC